MTFAKGKEKTGGRKAGVVNKDTSRFKEALSELFEQNADNMINWLEQIDQPEKRFVILKDFAEFLFPKLQRTEMSGINGEPIATKHEEIRRTIVDPKNDSSDN